MPLQIPVHGTRPQLFVLAAVIEHFMLDFMRTSVIFWVIFNFRLWDIYLQYNGRPLKTKGYK